MTDSKPAGRDRRAWNMCQSELDAFYGTVEEDSNGIFPLLQFGLTKEGYEPHARSIASNG